MREVPLCRLCGGKWTMVHILSGCKTTLSQGKYRWRHDKVLAALANILEQGRGKRNQPKQDHCWARSPLWKRAKDRSSTAKPGRISCSHSPEVGNGSWPQKEPTLLRGITVHHSKTQHSHVVPRGKGDHPDGADSAVGGELWEREEKSQTPANCSRLPV